MSLVVAGLHRQDAPTICSGIQSETRGEQTGSDGRDGLGTRRWSRPSATRRTALEQFDEINERLRGYSLRAIFFSSITNPATRFVNSLVYAGVGITGALSRRFTAACTVGQLSGFLSYANQYTKPFNEISGVVTELQNALACAGRVFDAHRRAAADPRRAPTPGCSQDAQGRVASGACGLFLHDRTSR